MSTSKRVVFVGGALVILLAAMFFWIVSKNTGTSSSPKNSDRLSDQNTEVTASSKTVSVLGARGNAVSMPPNSSGTARTSTAFDTDSAAAYKIFKSAITAREALNLIEGTSAVTRQNKLYYSALIGELCSDPALEKLRNSPTRASNPTSANNPTISVEREHARSLLEQKRLLRYCEGMPILSVEAQRAAWTEAANSGDPRAKARLDWVAFEGTFKPDPTVPAGGPLSPDKTLSPPTWDPATLNSLIRGMSTRDPAAIVNIGNMLQQTGHTNFVALGTTGQSLADVPIATWNLVACQYGAQCGKDNTTLLTACANEGRCDVPTIEDYYRRYVWTNEEAARYDALLPYLRDLIDKGDVSLLTILNFDPSKAPQNRYYGRPPRPYKPG